MILAVHSVILVQHCGVLGGLSLTPEVFPYVPPLTELGRGYPSLLAIQLHSGFSHHWHSQSLSLEGSLQFTTFTVMNTLFTL